MDRRTFIASAALVSGCGLNKRAEKENPRVMTTPSHRMIYKQAEAFSPYLNEPCPFVLNDRLLLFTSKRSGFNPLGFDIWDYHSKELLASKPWAGIFASLVVADGGTMHIYGANGPDALGNRVIHSELDANFNPSPYNVVWQANPTCDRVWNVSVDRDPTGYVMALETLYPGSNAPNSPGFAIIINHAADPSGPWSSMGWGFNYASDAPYNLMFEAYCPTIKYHNGWYYNFFMHPDTFPTKGQFKTYVARSRNCMPGSWELMWTPVLSPDGSQFETQNNSDFDFVEHRGICWGAYLAGDQGGFIPTKRCAIGATKAQFLESLFA